MIGSAEHHQQKWLFFLKAAKHTIQKTTLNWGTGGHDLCGVVLHGMAVFFEEPGMSEYMPEDMPDRMPNRMPEDMSDRVPEDMPDRMPEDLPDRMPEDMPEDMPDHMPEDMPDRMPNRMSEDMSDRMPEDLPVRKCINVMVGITRSKVIG